MQDAYSNFFGKSFDFMVTVTSRFSSVVSTRMYIFLNFSPGLSFPYIAEVHFMNALFQPNVIYKNN